MSKDERFFASEETVTVDLDGDYWVELKRELDYGEESELEGAAIKAGLNPDGSPRLEFSLKQQRILLMSLYLVDWNLPGANGKAVPLPPTNSGLINTRGRSLERRQEVIGHLRPKWAKKINEWITRIRAEADAVDALSLKDLDGAEMDPTEPGDGSVPATPSSSPAGGEGSPTTMSNGLLIASSARPSR